MCFILQRRQNGLKNLSYLSFADRLVANRFFVCLPAKFKEFIKKILFNRTVCLVAEKLLNGFKKVAGGGLRAVQFGFKRRN